MRKFKRKLKFFVNDNFKVVVAFIIGIILSSTGVYAATKYYNGVNVSYSNTTSGLSSTDVQGAIDELYLKTKTRVNTNNMGTPQYYAFGKYKGWCSTTNPDCNSLPDFPTTDTTPPSNKKMYLVKYEDRQYGICIKINETPYCFRGRNYIAEVEHIKEVFSSGACVVSSNTIHCAISTNFYCNIQSNGSIACVDRETNVNCNIYGDGTLECTE